MKTKLERVEVKRTVLGDDYLAVEDAARRQLFQQRSDQLREVTIQRFAVAALNEDFCAVAKDQRTKAVPFRFENPGAGSGQFADALRQHR